MRLVHGSVEIATLSIDHPVFPFLKGTSDNSKNVVRFALVGSSSNNKQLYAAIDSRFNVVELDKDPYPRLRICTLRRAKGPGFVAIGTSWGAQILDFSSGPDSEYTDEGRIQAGIVAAELAALVGYEVVEENYGADY